MPGIGARILEQLDPQRLEHPVRGAAELEVGPLRAAVVHGHHVLGARLGPATRPPGRARQGAHEDVLDVEALAAEAAAHVGGDDADLLGLQPERGGDPRLVLMRGLGREADGELAVLELGDGRARLDRQREQAGALIGAGDDHVAAVEQVLVAGAGDAQARVGARRLEEQDLVLDHLADIGDRGQRRRSRPPPARRRRPTPRATRRPPRPRSRRRSAPLQPPSAARFMLSWTWIIGGGGLGCSPRSAAVKTWTPGSARASSASIDVIVPWATEERTKVT